MWAKKQLKNLLEKIAHKYISHYPIFLIEDVLSRKTNVLVDGKICFTVHDFGSKTRWRAESIESKEPETLEWINSFTEGSILLDVGSNLGIFSLYAASRGIKSIALEPQALNFASLYLNRIENGFEELIEIFPICASNQFSLSQLNMREASIWGGSGSSFSRKIAENGRDLGDIFSVEQGSVGIQIDNAVKYFSEFPTHIKIDVDGNELLVLEGARQMLSDQRLISVLVELCQDHPEYSSSISLLESLGFELSFKKPADKNNTSNHIFHKTPSTETS